MKTKVTPDRQDFSALAAHDVMRPGDEEVVPARARHIDRAADMLL